MFFYKDFDDPKPFVAPSARFVADEESEKILKKVKS